MLPLYPSTTNAAAFTVPTFVPAANDPLAWPTDTFKPQNPQPTSVRPDRPRLIAPEYRWQALPALIQQDAYLKNWNESIFQNATQYASLPVVKYNLDGSSGILDNAREIKMRIKAFAYAYRMSNQTSWVDKAWAELQNAAGNGSQPFGADSGGPDMWNPTHFLDTAEFINAYAIAYDWLYDVWTPDQRESIMWTMIQFGMIPGVGAFNGNSSTGGWQSNTEGNWNCVCNSGLTIGALALLGDDTTGTSETLLSHTIQNTLQNCVLAVSDDGSWAETPHYWYFGTTGHTEMAAALMSAAGSDFGLLTTNTAFELTPLFHMASNGPGTIYSYGDHGPNTFSTTANSLLFYGDYYNHPEYMLYQRDQHDAIEPFAMFYYDPTVTGAFWDQLALDHFFTNNTDQWASMRSSWTDEDALYVAIKAGTLVGHQTHNDLDCGDFVLDALGARWAGDLGSEDYNSQGYFSSDAQDSQRWLYYRKRTEGQNTVLVAGQNQLVTAHPSIMGNGTTGDEQGSSTVYDVPADSTAFWAADLASAYGNVTAFQRGVRMLNARRQVLLQDDITASQPLVWRMHTNASVSLDPNNPTSATLTIGSETLTMRILNAPSGAAFGTANATRLDTDPPLPVDQATGVQETDMPNPGVTVLTIALPAGQYSIQVLFNPQWPGMSSSDFVTPANVPLTQWSLHSHDQS